MSRINSIIIFKTPSPNSTFNAHNPYGIKLLTRLRVALSPLRQHKCKHNFQESLGPFCNCGWHIETSIHFFSSESASAFKKQILKFVRQVLKVRLMCTILVELNCLHD